MTAHLAGLLCELNVY